MPYGETKLSILSACKNPHQKKKAEATKLLRLFTIYSVFSGILQTLIDTKTVLR